MAEYCRRENADLFGESGFDYCLDAYRFGQDFTPQTIVAIRDEDGQYEDEKEKERDLTGVREVFARYR
ncbi:hypothetical protein LV779_36360 [Streptomyces thinghirensis]|nr:hypothetical protein [Streptomyces thinghirensis]